MNFIPPRLRRPAMVAFGGTLFAAAWIVHGGPLWFMSIVTEVAVAVLALSVYVRGGQDTDEGAMAGSRADERLRQLSLRSRALAGDIGLGAAYAGLIIAVAARSPFWWPFVIMIAVLGFGRLLGLSLYGSPEDDPDDAGATGHRAATDRTRPWYA